MADSARGASPLRFGSPRRSSSKSRRVPPGVVLIPTRSARVKRRVGLERADEREDVVVGDAEPFGDPTRGRQPDQEPVPRELEP